MINTNNMKAILSEFRDLTRLTTLLAPPRTHGFKEIRSHDGTTKRDKHDIAEVFACFYESLYKSQDIRRGPSMYKAPVLAQLIFSRMMSWAPR